MTRIAKLGFGLVGLAGLLACNGSMAPEKDDVEVDDTATDDSSEPTEFTFNTDDFPPEVYVAGVNRITFEGKLHHSLWGYDVDVSADGRYLCMGAPGQDSFSGALGCLDLSKYSVGDNLGTGDLAFVAEGAKDEYVGLTVATREDYVFSGAQGATTNANQDGMTLVYPIATTNGTFTATDQTLAALVGMGPLDWANPRWVKESDNTVVVGTSASATGFGCSAKSLTDGTYSAVTLLDAAGCWSVTAVEHDEYGWPWYRVAKPEGSDWTYFSDPQQGVDGLSLAGSVQAFDSSGNLHELTLRGENNNQLGATLISFRDMNKSGVGDVLVVSAEQDYMQFVGDGEQGPLSLIGSIVLGPSHAKGVASEYWGIDVEHVTFADGTTIVAIGAMFAYRPDNVRTGAVYLYELTELIAGGDPFTVIFGEVSGDNFGRSLTTYYAGSAPNSYEEIYFAMCGDRGGICYYMSLYDIANGGAAASAFTTTRVSTGGGSLMPIAKPSFQWLFPTEPSPLGNVGVSTAAH